MTVHKMSKQNGQGTKRDLSNVTYISRRDGSRLLDRQARKYLNMSGEEFKKQFRDGTIPEPERSAVIRVSMLLPLAED